MSTYTPTGRSARCATSWTSAACAAAVPVPPLCATPTAPSPEKRGKAGRTTANDPTATEWADVPETAAPSRLGCARHRLGSRGRGSWRKRTGTRRGSFRRPASTALTCRSVELPPPCSPCSQLSASSAGRYCSRSVRPPATWLSATPVNRRPAAARRDAEGTAAETSARLRRSEAAGRAERPTLRCITPSPAACQHLRRVAALTPEPWA